MNRFDMSNPLKKPTFSINTPPVRSGGGSRGGRGYWGYVNHRDGSKSWDFIYGQSRSAATPASITTSGNQISGSLLDLGFHDSDLGDGQDLPDDPVDGEDEEVLHYGVPTFHHEDGSLYVGGMDHEYSKKISNPTQDLDRLYDKTYGYVLEKGIQGFSNGTIIDDIRSKDDTLQYSPRDQDAPSTTSRLTIGEDGQTYIPHELQYLVAQMAKDEILRDIYEKHPRGYTPEGEMYSDSESEQSQARDENENVDDDLVHEEPLDAEVELAETEGEDVDRDPRIINPENDQIDADTYSETLEAEKILQENVDPRKIEGSHWLNENNSESALAKLLKQIDDTHTEIHASATAMAKKSMTVDDFIKMISSSNLNNNTGRGNISYGNINYQELIQKAHNMAVTADMLGYQMITANSIEMPDKITGFAPGTDPIKKDKYGKNITKGGGPLVYFLKGNKDILSSDKKIASVMGDTIQGFTKQEIDILEEINANIDGFSHNNPVAVKNKQTVLKLAETLDRLGLDWSQEKWQKLWQRTDSIIENEHKNPDGGKFTGSGNQTDFASTTVDAGTIMELFDNHIDPKIEEKKREILSKAQSFSSSGFILSATMPTRTTRFSQLGGRDGLDPSQVIHDNQNDFENPILFIPGRSHYGGGRPLEDYSNGTSTIESIEGETPFDFAERKMHAGLSNKIADLMEKTPSIRPLSEGDRDLTDFEKFINLVSPDTDSIEVLANYRRAKSPYVSEDAAETAKKKNEVPIGAVITKTAYEGSKKGIDDFYQKVEAKANINYVKNGKPFVFQSGDSTEISKDLYDKIKEITSYTFDPDTKKEKEIFDDIFKDVVYKGPDGEFTKYAAAEKIKKEYEKFETYKNNVLQYEGHKKIADNLATKCLEWAQANNTSIITPDHDLYPHALRSIGSDAPQILFVRHNGSDLSLMESLGKSPQEEGSLKLLAGVGTRNVGTQQSGKWKGSGTTDPGIIGSGQRFARNVTKYFAQKGWVMVSGLADGIDSICHDEAIRSHPSSKTIAILGGGIDAGHIERNLAVDPFTGNLQGIKSKQIMRLQLMRSILANGGLLISERLPGESSTGEYLTKRNRLQTGMSAGAIAFETPDVRPGTDRDTGTMRTVASAVHQDRILATIDPSAWLGTATLSPEKLAEAEMLVSGNKRMILEHGAHAIQSIDPNHQSLLALEAKLEAKHASIADSVSNEKTNGLVAYPQEDTRKTSWEKHAEEHGIDRNGINALISPFPPEILKGAFDHYRDLPQKPTVGNQDDLTWKRIIESPAIDTQKEKQKSNWLGKNVQQAFADAIVLFQTHLSSENFGHIAKAIAQGKSLFTDQADKSLGNTGTQALEKERLPNRMTYVPGAAPKGKSNGSQSYWSWSPSKMMNDTLLAQSSSSSASISSLIKSIANPEISKASRNHSSYETSVATNKRMNIDPRIKSSTMVLGSKYSPIRMEIKKQIKKIDGKMVVYHELTMFRKSTGKKYTAVAKQRYYGNVGEISRKKDVVKADKYADFLGMQYAAKMFASYVTRRQYFHSVLKQKSRDMQSPITPSQVDETIVGGINHQTPHWGNWESFGPTIDPTQSILGNINLPQVSNSHQPSWDGKMHDLRFEENKNFGNEIADNLIQNINDEITDVKAGDTAHIASEPITDIDLGALRDFRGSSEKPRISFVSSTWMQSPAHAGKTETNNLNITSDADLISAPVTVGDWFKGKARRKIRSEQFGKMFVDTTGQTNTKGQMWLQNLARSNISVYFVPYSPLLFRATPLPQIPTTDGAMLSKTSPSFVVSSNIGVNKALFYPQIEKQSPSQDAKKSVSDQDWRSNLRTKDLLGIAGKYLGPESSVFVENNKPLPAETPKRPSTAVIIGTTTTGNANKDERHMYLSMGYAVNMGLAKLIGKSHSSGAIQPLSEELGIDKFTRDTGSQAYLHSVFSGEDIKFSDDSAIKEKQVKAELFARIYMKHVIKEMTGKDIFTEIDQTTGLATDLKDVLTDIKGAIHQLAESHMSSRYNPSRFPDYVAGKSMYEGEPEYEEIPVVSRNEKYYNPIDHIKERADTQRQGSLLGTPAGFTIGSIAESTTNRAEFLDAIARNSKSLSKNSWDIVKDLIVGNSSQNTNFFDNVIKKITYSSSPQGTKISIPHDASIDPNNMRNSALVLYDKYLEEKSGYKLWALDESYNETRKKILNAVFERTKTDTLLSDKISPDGEPIEIKDVVNYLLDPTKSNTNDIIDCISAASGSTGIDINEAKNAMLWGVNLGSRRIRDQQIPTSVEDTAGIYNSFLLSRTVAPGCLSLNTDRSALGVFLNSVDRDSKIKTMDEHLTFKDWLDKSLAKIKNNSQQSQGIIESVFELVLDGMNNGFPKG